MIYIKVLKFIDTKSGLKIIKIAILIKKSWIKIEI